MHGLESSARALFGSAIAIFTVTIVIGILNGLEVWEPSHNLLLTHVHAGTLGWITLAVVGAAMLVFGRGAPPNVVASARRLTIVVVASTVLYVAAFAMTTGILRPITGTLMLAAIVWVLAWTWKRWGDAERSTAQLGLLLALVSLTIGAVLGVLLGLFIARGSIPGLDTETAGSLAGAHPPAMLIGYLILGGAAITHWLLEGSPARSGRLVMWALFVAGIVANLAFILGIDPLIQVATMLEVVAIVTFVAHLWPRLRPSAWAGSPATDAARVAVVFLVVGILLLVYVVQLVVSGELDPETGAGPVGVLLGFDHTMFIGVMTNALIALVARLAGNRVSGAGFAGVNIGLVAFLAGLVTDVPVLIRIGAPLMGITLLIVLGGLMGRIRPRSAAEAG